MHNKLTIVGIKKASILLHLKKHNYTLKERQIAIVNPYELHSATNVDESSHGLYALYLDKDWVEKLQHNLLGIKGYIPFEKNIIDSSEAYASFIRLCDGLQKKGSYENKKQDLIKFISNLTLKYSAKELCLSNNLLVKDIKAYIDRNIDSNMTLEDISREFLITPFHLIKIFKKELNLTPYQYILNHKVNFAKELLSKDLAITQVAVLAGFNDQSHLYKYFKQTFSISPKEYKDSLSNFICK